VTQKVNRVEIIREHKEIFTASLIWIIGVRVRCRSGGDECISYYISLPAVDKFRYFKQNLYYPSD
jgi:hypothetical protein